MPPGAILRRLSGRLAFGLLALGVLLIDPTLSHFPMPLSLVGRTSFALPDEICDLPNAIVPVHLYLLLVRSNKWTPFVSRPSDGGDEAKANGRDRDARTASNRNYTPLPTPARLGHTAVTRTLQCRKSSNTGEADMSPRAAGPSIRPAAERPENRRHGCKVGSTGSLAKSSSSTKRRTSGRRSPPDGLCSPGRASSAQLSQRRKRSGRARGCAQSLDLRRLGFPDRRRGKSFASRFKRSSAAPRTGSRTSQRAMNSKVPRHSRRITCCTRAI